MPRCNRVFNLKSGKLPVFPARILNQVIKCKPCLSPKLNSIGSMLTCYGVRLTIALKTLRRVFAKGSMFNLHRSSRGGLAFLASFDFSRNKIRR